jgi:hypothetical protein
MGIGLTNFTAALHSLSPSDFELDTTDLILKPFLPIKVATSVVQLQALSALFVGKGKFEIATGYLAAWDAKPIWTH